jgi:hypothetical protein
MKDPDKEEDSAGNDQVDFLAHQLTPLCRLTEAPSSLHYSLTGFHMGERLEWARSRSPTMVASSIPAFPLDAFIDSVSPT